MAISHIFNEVVVTIYRSANGTQHHNFLLENMMRGKLLASLCVAIHACEFSNISFGVKRKVYSPYSQNDILHLFYINVYIDHHNKHKSSQ